MKKFLIAMLLVLTINSKSFCINAKLKAALASEIMMNFPFDPEEITIDQMLCNLNGFHFCDERTILMYAAEDENINLVHLLLLARADPFVKDNKGKTLFDYATLRVLRFLINYFNEQFQAPDYFLNDVPMEQN